MLRSSRRLLSTATRHDWTKQEITAIYRLPFTELLHRAATTHRLHFDPLEVQRCTLLSIKTGGCNEDCKYCAQSTRYKTFVKPTPMMSVDEVCAPPFFSPFARLISLTAALPTLLLAGGGGGEAGQVGGLDAVLHGHRLARDGQQEGRLR